MGNPDSRSRLVERLRELLDQLGAPQAGNQMSRSRACWTTPRSASGPR